ncbi:MAG: DUF3977 family protein [Candidatus Paceibacterota bacterium]
MKKVFAEIGIGNPSFFSTEFEKGGEEYRIPEFILPKRVKGYYLRIWIFKKVYIISTNKYFQTSKKDKNNFKLVVGVSGVNLV